MCVCVCVREGVRVSIIHFNSCSIILWLTPCFSMPPSPLVLPRHQRTNELLQLQALLDQKEKDAWEAKEMELREQMEDDLEFDATKTLVRARVLCAWVCSFVRFCARCAVARVLIMFVCVCVLLL